MKKNKQKILWENNQIINICIYTSYNKTIKTLHWMNSSTPTFQKRLLKFNFSNMVNWFKKKKGLSKRNCKI